jgi:hypothetical protein
VDFSATELHRCSSGLLLRKVSAEERILETDKEYFPIPEANILDAKKLVWSQVNPKLRCTELFLLESQTSRGEVRNFGLLGFEFKID